ncbi:Hybrid sensory histidine kinase in two-component regulatory system with EvgA [Klebsiella pneumoniae ISC21]|nr:Hybrid sensory histidine kinase in two-component regulatory system with EvgA [Klebsiella pneumoniae ISC21]
MCWSPAAAPPDQHLLKRSARIALPVGPIAAHDLKARFPLINWVETDNVASP